MRTIYLACLLCVASPSHATPKQFTNELALALQKGGWTNPTRLHDSPAIRVIAATKQGKQYVLYATPDGAALFALIVGAEVPAQNTVTVTESTAYGTLAGLATIDVTYVEKRANGGSRSDTKTSIVRRGDATVACVIEAAEVTEAGSTCGSSGWRSVSVRRVLATQPTFDVSISQSGNFSRPTPNGQCLAASPIRSPTKVTRVVIQPNRMCTRGDVPKGAPQPDIE